MKVLQIAAVCLAALAPLSAFGQSSFGSAVCTGSFEIRGVLDPERAQLDLATQGQLTFNSIPTPSNPRLKIGGTVLLVNGGGFDYGLELVPATAAAPAHLMIREAGIDSDNKPKFESSEGTIDDGVSFSEETKDHMVSITCKYLVP